MDRINTKDYLSQAFTLNAQINADLLEACRLRSLADRTEQAFGTSRHGRASRLEQVLGQLSRLEDEVADNIQLLVKNKTRIRRIISRLDKEEERRVLWLRYVEGFKWDEIADSMHYSYKWVHILHGRAIKKLKPYIEVHANEPL